jgi:hypothetical protein
MMKFQFAFMKNYEYMTFEIELNFMGKWIYGIYEMTDGGWNYDIF